jgi:lysophospholipase L1-like esterase
MGCTPNEIMVENKNRIDAEKKLKDLKYLALGDSYTIGEGERSENSYPIQVTELLEREGFLFSTTKIIAKTGWTSGELLKAVEKENIMPDSFNFASLLIGVNNQYRRQTLAQFKVELTKLIEITLPFVGDQKDKLVLISIPDWGVTSFGQSGIRPTDQIAKEIDAYNEVVRQEALAYGLPFIDITNSYRSNGGISENMVADGLHPSRFIYRDWAFFISEKIKESVK